MKVAELTSPLVIDVETIEILEDGSTVASTEAYRDNFRVSSMAYYDGTRQGFIEGERQCREWLRDNAQDKQLIAHNCQYEQLVSKCRFPELTLNFCIDSMRLAQIWDNGGDENHDVEYIYSEELDEDERPKVKRKPTTGLSLVACTKRILGATESHKEEAHSWLRAQGVKKGKEGANLHLLPSDILERYNIGDVVNTWRLYEHISSAFKADGFDWRRDHDLFLSSVSHLVSAKIRGVLVQRDRLRDNLNAVRMELVNIERGFANRFAAEIHAIEIRRTDLWINGPKTERGRAKRAQRLADASLGSIKGLSFSAASNKQLAELFVDMLKMEPKFFTAKGAPSFKSSMLNQWGEGGEMLKTRRKRLLIIQQMVSLLRMSEHDGKWHVDLRAAATSTGRMGGGKR